MALGRCVMQLKMTGCFAQAIFKTRSTPKNGTVAAQSDLEATPGG